MYLITLNILRTCVCVCVYMLNKFKKDIYLQIKNQVKKFKTKERFVKRN